MTIKFNMTEEQVKELEQCIEVHKQKPGPLMPILHDAQRIFGCIPLPVQKIISKATGESVAFINGIVTFYSHFSIEPKGKHVISVCLGTACYVRGAQKILDEVTSILKVKPGETTEDNEFTIEASRCVGACGLAPVFTIDGVVYGNGTPDMAAKAIKKIKEDKHEA